jgi:RES domain-containing protein
MILYRFSAKKYAASLDGEGAKRWGGRWNLPGKPVVYSSQSISLALLELLAHNVAYEELRDHVLIRIRVPDLIKPARPFRLKTDWKNDPGYSQYIGSQFLAGLSALLQPVPSVIVPEENNMLINPLHPDMSKLKIVSVEAFQFDPRLF